MALYKVIGANIKIRQAPGLNTQVLDGYLYQGGNLTVTEEKTIDGYVWGKHAKGWSCIKTASGESYMTLIPAPEAGANKPESTLKEQAEADKYDAEANKFLEDLKNEFGVDFSFNNQYTQYANDLLNNLRVSNTSGIHGIPYQLMEIADRRLMDNQPDALGRKYAEKIIQGMPLLLMVPGVPQFLGDQSAKTKKGALARILGGISDALDIHDLESTISGSSKYYTLKPEYVEYFKYVNPMCRTAARLLELQNYKLDGENLDSYHWEYNTNNKIHKIWSNYLDGVPFYIHSDTQISESFSNGTSASALASSVNSSSDMARELNFILGTAGSQVGKELNAFMNFENVERNLENIDDIVSKTVGSGGVLGSLVKSIASKATVLASGSKLIFPEIWSDSEFSRSYNVQVKLVSPDCDTLSWYLNIFAPLAHLLAFVLPRGVDATNAYGSPFICRAIYKGFFNCDMGIITDMTVNRGTECAWTREGLPTVVDVSFTIKDLYSIMTISKYGSFMEGALTNMTQLDYIATMCGVDINEPDIKRQLDMMMTHNFENRVKDFWSNTAASIYHAINNKAVNFMSGLFMPK